MRAAVQNKWAGLVALLLLVFSHTYAQETPPPAAAPKQLKVGVVAIPPLVILEQGGGWSGIGVEVWQEVADSLGWEYQFVPYRNHDELGKAIQSGQIDLAIPSIPVYALAPQDISFSQPFFSSEYAAAVSPQTWKITWFNSLGALVSAGILEFFLALLVLLICGGFLIWICERRRNPGEFGGSIIEGIGHGIWWSAVTMTTVGYGDKSPQTLLGRLVAFVWMFSGFILLSVFVSALVSNISSKVHSGMDAVRTLKGTRVGVLSDSPASFFLQARGIQPIQFKDLNDLKLAFGRHQIDAIFGDSAHLQRVNWEPIGIRPLIVSQSNGANWYAFAFRNGSPLEEPLNRAILKFIQQPRWSEIISSSPGSLGRPGF